MIKIETRIDASIETVFDLARSIDLHVQSTAQTNEKTVAGCTIGLISLGESVTWEATHFGVKQRLATQLVGRKYTTFSYDLMFPSPQTFQKT